MIAANGKDTALFVVSTSTPSIYNDVEFAASLKKSYPDSKVLLVGTHPSALPHETLRLNEAIDFVARKEFDDIVLELAIALDEGKDPYQVKGITYRKDGEIISNPDMPYITDLDRIPYAAKFIHEHLNHKDYFFAAASYPEIQIFTGRGCMARCNFCVYPQTMHGPCIPTEKPGKCSGRI